ncbi:transcriptional regulator, gntR-family [Mycobacterium tuberculosis SUMu011]|nr:transcriptional regulator, gntR-family [Mycobacterium tuberculosis SUMu011]
MSTEPDAVWTDKRASKIARRIEADIVRRGWPIGASLGSESALQQRFCVSRSVLREAVRLVEHHQVARMRRGPNGGLFICEPNAGPATRAVVIYLEYLGTTIGDLLGARLVLEPLAASLAAEHIDEPGIERLRAVLRAEERWRPGLPPPPEQFYRVLAEQSKNPVLQLFIDILMRLTKRYVQKSGTQSAGEAVEAAGQVHNEHSDIVAAVTAGDSAWAKTLSERHVEAVAGWLQQHQRGNDAAVRNGGRAREPRRAQQLILGAPRGKLAEVLAATIGDDIAASGWQVGSVFGTETALLERYQVSRAVLREAVRLLEYHAIAHMRRGPGGGLVVTTPSHKPASTPSRSICSTASRAAKTYGASGMPSRSTMSRKLSSAAANLRLRPSSIRWGGRGWITPPTMYARPPSRSFGSTSDWRERPAIRCWICSC